MTLLKICGMTDLSLVRRAARQGVPFLGFILIPASPRYCHPEQAELHIKWLRQHYPRTKSVVILASDNPDEIVAIHKTLRPDFIQLYTTLKPDDFNKIRVSGLIKVFSVQGPMKEADIIAYKAEYYLFDTYKRDKQGGSGEKFDWTGIPVSVLPKSFIAGGLRPADIANIVKGFHPFAVDLNSTLERTRGKKSPARIEKALRYWKRGLPSRSVQV